MLCKARLFINKDDLKNLYYAICFLLLLLLIWYTVVRFGIKNLTRSTKKVVKLQNRALHIITFSDFRADSNPLYADLNILKLADHITLQNCLFVHDALNRISPICFHEYFSLTKTIHSLNTKKSDLGCIFVTSSGTVTYGLNYITSKCIFSLNLTAKCTIFS